MKKALIFLALLLAVLIGEMLTFGNNSKTHEEEAYIAVSNFALYEIAEKIVNKKIEIKKLVPFGVEAHTYIPSVKTIKDLTKAKLFVFNGLGLEPWVKKEYPNQMNMSKLVHLHLNDKSEHEEEDEGHSHDDEEADPHYWLDIENMILMTEALREKLAKLYPQYAAEFNQNSKIYINELRELDAEYSKTLLRCARREIVVNHNAFAYLGARYDFSSHSITGLSPDEQASAKRMKEIADLLKEEKFNVIFFESFVSPSLAQTISNETGVRAESLQPLANVTEDEAKKGYIVLMKENLQKLSAAMECE